MLPWAWKLTSYCKNFAHFVLLCFFGILLAQNLQHIGIFKIFHILIKAQQVLNFLTSREFQPANFLKKFLHLVHFEPQFSYKWVLIKKKCISIMAQQVLNFLTSREFQPAIFLKKFLSLGNFEPQFSYSEFL